MRTHSHAVKARESARSKWGGPCAGWYKIRCEGKELGLFKVGSMMRTDMNTMVSEHCDLAINENNHI